MGSNSDAGSEFVKNINSNGRKRKVDSLIENLHNGKGDTEDGLGIDEKNGTVEAVAEDEQGSMKDGSLAEIGEDGLVDFKGLEFDTLEEGYELYNTYARWHGFVVRKHYRKKDGSGNIIMRDLVCNRQGMRNKKHKERVDRVREPRGETRMNCEAMIRLRYQQSSLKWKVVQFVESHNHNLTPPEQVHLHPRYRLITDADKAQLKCMHTNGVRTCQILSYMLGQKGGHAALGFSKKDAYNFISKETREETEQGDAYATICYFDEKAEKDHLFYSIFDEKDGKFGNLFWVDGVGRTDYKCFGDVLAFDSTYGTNKYKMPLVILSGTNSHGNTVVFGAALLTDEKTETYKWLLEVFLDAMEGKHPVAVVTDGDGAMRDAIKDVFPGSLHRLCAWHLNRNAVEHVKSKSFLNDFNRAMYENMTVAEFEQLWDNSVRSNKLSENSWVRKTYKNKKMWAAAYLRDKFFGGIRTTSICEGINSFINKYVKRTNNLLEFVVNFERAVKEYRHNELVADFKTMSSDPVLNASLAAYESDAARRYTREIFVDVKKEIVKAGNMQVPCEDVDGDTVNMNVEEFGKKGVYTVVTYNVNDNRFECQCKLFESRGIPCCHLFVAMRQKHIPAIPNSLILKRWTKDAKASYIAEMKDDSNDLQKATRFRFAALAADCNRLCEAASKNIEDFVEVQKEISKLIVHVGKRVEERRKKKPVQKLIGDPCPVKTKGAPRKTMKVKRKKKCSKCRRSGHDIRTCPKSKTLSFEVTADEDAETSESESHVGAASGLDEFADGDHSDDSDNIYVGEQGLHKGVDNADAYISERDGERILNSTQESVYKCNGKVVDKADALPMVRDGEGMVNSTQESVYKFNGKTKIDATTSTKFSRNGADGNYRGKDYFGMGFSALELLRGVEDPRWKETK